MAVNLLLLLFAILLYFFLPGFTFIQMLFPRKKSLDVEFDWIYRLALSMVMSITFIILVGLVLGSIKPPEGQKGYFQGITTGYPIIEVTILSLSGLFFIIGWYRGGYPWLKYIHPKLYRVVPPDKKEIGETEIDDQETLKRLNDLLEEWEKTKELLEKSQKNQKKYLHDENVRKTYIQKVKTLQSKLNELNKEIEKIQSEARRK